MYLERLRGHPGAGHGEYWRETQGEISKRSPCVFMGIKTGPKWLTLFSERIADFKGRIGVFKESLHSKTPVAFKELSESVSQPSVHGERESVCRNSHGFKEAFMKISLRK